MGKKPRVRLLLEMIDLEVCGEGIEQDCGELRWLEKDMEEVVDTGEGTL